MSKLDEAEAVRQFYVEMVALFLFIWALLPGRR